MAQSYMLNILHDGNVQAQERRAFADLPRSEYARLGMLQYPDGSIRDADALTLVNSWNVKACNEAQRAGIPLRFVYFL